MSDIPHQGAMSSSRRTKALSLPWPLAPYLCAFAAGAAGLLAGRELGGDASAFEDRLVLLLRFMAAMKFAGVVGAALVLHWRLTQPVAPRLAIAYVAALGTMAVAPGLIWSLGAIAAGALLFHVGLLAFLLLAWRDDGTHLPFRR